MKLLALSLLLCGITAAQSAKDAMLQAVVKNVVTPGYACLAETCRDLADAAGKFDAEPVAEHLEKSRACWLAAAIAAQELDAFKIGPIADAGDASAFYFLPVRPASVERAIQGDADLQQLGAAAKGLFAMEYLLFPKSGDALAEPKRRHYFSLIAQDAAAVAVRLKKAWEAPYSISAKRFLAGGQDSLNTLVNQMAMTSESVAVLRMDPYKTARTPGAASGHSEVLVLAAVRGLHRIHAGGLNDYTRRLNTPLADRVDQEFAATQNEVSAESRNSLNVLHKVDLPSTLGVTLTFISTDGD
jgi:predicted lipoprotein